VKKCTKCKEHKPFSEFYKNAMGKDDLKSQCKLCIGTQNKEYRQVNSEKTVANKKKYYQNNSKKLKASTKKYYQANYEKKKVKAEKWRQANPEKVAAYAARYRAAKLQATVDWANNFLIEEIYAHSQLLTKMNGIKYHVDHIVPLQHPKVCGLHCEHNLQVITGRENNSKNNKFEIN